MNICLRIFAVICRWTNYLNTHVYLLGPQPDAICIKSESANAAFASWIPREVQNCLQDKQNMYVGKAFADCMGVKEHDMVR